MQNICLMIISLTVILAPSVFAVDFYVSPAGSDTNPGSISQPFATITKAKDTIAQADNLKTSPVNVYLQGGVYYLDSTIVFSPEDSGTAGSPVTYSACQNETVIISGGANLNLTWHPYKNGILQALTPAGTEIDQLFVNGQRQPMARYPNYDPNARPYNGAAADAFSRERAKNWADPAGGYIHAMHRAHWGGYHYRITGKNPDNTVLYEGGWQNNRQMGMHPKERMVENIFEELDTPGEWYHNKKTQTLYFYPPASVDVKTATFEIARLKHLIEIKGSRKNPVRNIHLKGLTFRHASRTFMETKEPLLRSDWTIYRGGTVLIDGAEDCSIADCRFDQVGGNAIFINNYNRRININTTHIFGAGASGICFVGDSDSVRNPLFEYNQKNTYSQIDMTPGPKTDNYPAQCIVDNCLIHSVSIVEKQATGIQVSMASDITIRHCSIYDVGRAGINISEGTFGGHIIEFCDVFDTVRETGDHGSFNSWGRDRFWHLKEAPAEELPGLSRLDAKHTIIRNSRWRCDRGWDVDLDDGSSNYEIYNNLFLRGGLKLREGFHRLVYNNIAVNNGLHPHVWYKNCGDIVTNNIWMAPHKPALMHKEKWGKQIDWNLFTRQADRDKFAANGCDRNSTVGDPMFVNPANGDFRVRPDSPALKIGFRNFPMDQFGVMAPTLKAIARTPEFPVPKIPESAVGTSSESEKQATWLGATVKPLTGQEFSAFGISREAGGIQILTIPASSLAQKAGLRPDDVIQTINGKPVKTIAQLKKAAQAGSTLTIDLVRNQNSMTVTVKK